MLSRRNETILFTEIKSNTKEVYSWKKLFLGENLDVHTFQYVQWFLRCFINHNQEVNPFFFSCV